MSPSTDRNVAELIEAVLAHARTKLAPEEFAQVQAFIPLYYAQVDADDLLDREVVDLYGAALSHWQFLQRYQGGRPKLRVYNPRVDEHGWQSSHTIIEIVNDDMPFLVDSVGMEVNRHGLALHLIIHPVVRCRRDASGQLETLFTNGEPAEGASFQSTIHVEVDRQTKPEKLEALQQDLLRILSDVRAVVDDWRGMTAAMNATIARVAQSQLDGVVESRHFLEWLVDNHFTFLGYREYDLIQEGEKDYLRVVPGTGRGILRQTAEDAAPPALLPPAARAFIDGPDLLLVTKANMRATVHRPGYLDYIGVKRLDEAGRVTGELRFVGLFTSTAYSAMPSEIPLLRKKTSMMIERAGFLPRSHMAKALQAIIDNYPRDELFDVTEEELLATSMGILRLQERQRLRLFVRPDRFGRFISCLVFVPRDRFNTEVRQRIQAILMQAFNGLASEFTQQLSESVLARLHVMIRTEPGQVPAYDVHELERRIGLATRRWADDLRDAVLEQYGEEHGNELFRRYGEAFPAGYREDYPARAAVYDLGVMDALTPQSPLAMNLYAPLEAKVGSLRFKVFHYGGAVPLSESLPMLERMGVKVREERPYRIEPESRGGETASQVWITDFGLELPDGMEVDIDRVKTVFQDSFAQAWAGKIESDDLNRLVLASGLEAGQITILRAYARYLKQIGVTFSQAYMEAALTRNAGIARQLVEYFELRFDPLRGENREADMNTLLAEIRQALDQVVSLDEDRIIRQFLGTMQASLRTNHFQRGATGAPKDYLSFKLDPRAVPGLPEPKPMFEIFVYSPRVEGIHLRGGRVARGGLRWSDRREDFRTEVLGLVKAQMVKNAVIVPVGSKGGFVLKAAPPMSDREAYQKEGVACYRTFLFGLLDLTDNLVGGKVVPPRDVVRHDQDDPYLVVAADKGTATFSDIANGVAAEYGFWLGDAFASGGSVGYDHKKMGITAKGAWESVKRHFRSFGVNTQTTDFTVVGIGDMSGDVFGNGLLLSRHIKLLAAFDHRHIFLDPNPDAAQSFQERERLFNLPRSSWADYDASLISAGGGVFPRSAKTIALSPEVRKALDLAEESLAPNDLIRALLRAPVDLLYNGGIGTYVKASKQTHAEVGDRASDAVRVNGGELRCRVVAEGGNLGFTQLGRIEYALAGGLINTDAIDNSAGVDCSDHEVNIKILLDRVVAAGDLTEKQRNKLLAEMTDEVGELVLRDNYLQTGTLALAEAGAVHLVDWEARQIKSLEKSGRLNRAIEFLPSDETIAERKLAKRGLTSPEHAVLLAYSKMALYDDLLASNLPEDAYVAPTLVDYFPQPLRASLREAMAGHPLQREIIATTLANLLPNRVGSLFVARLQEETGANAAEIVRAFLLVREIFALDAVWCSIDALDAKVPTGAQIRMSIEAARLAFAATHWVLRRRRALGDIAAEVARLQPVVEALAKDLERLLAKAEREAFLAARDAFVAEGVPAALATRVAAFESMNAALDIAEVSTKLGRPVDTVASVYFALDEELDFSWLRKRILALPTDSHYQIMARAAIREDVRARQRELTARVLEHSPKQKAMEALLQSWQSAQAGVLEHTRGVIADLKSAKSVDLAMLSVALRELRGLG
ncbi:MAG: NAD-glutamate dehydrogenase [Betaproteobacteria bacterium]|nr:NAD-glutamate dehydrogenase [Betaproteobacteria bacterium]